MVSAGFKAYVLDQLHGLGAVTTRPMFGGLTFFHEGMAFALADDDRCYLKVDGTNRPEFEAAGMGPFLPFGDPDKPMQYYEVPPDVLEDPEVLAAWARRAVAVAARVRRPRRARA